MSTSYTVNYYQLLIVVLASSCMSWIPPLIFAASSTLDGPTLYGDTNDDGDAAFQRNIAQHRQAVLMSVPHRMTLMGSDNYGGS